MLIADNFCPFARHTNMALSEPRGIGGFNINHSLIIGMNSGNQLLQLNCREITCPKVCCPVFILNFNQLENIRTKENTWLYKYFKQLHNKFVNGNHIII